MRTTNPIESTFATVRLRTYRPVVAQDGDGHGLQTMPVRKIDWNHLAEITAASNS